MHTRRISPDVAARRIALVNILARAGFNKDKLLRLAEFPKVVGWSIQPVDTSRTRVGVSVTQGDELVYSTPINSTGGSIPAPLRGDYELGVAGMPADIHIGSKMQVNAPPGCLKFEWLLTLIYSDNSRQTVHGGVNEWFYGYTVGGSLIGVCGPVQRFVTASPPPWTITLPIGGAGSLEAAAWVGDDGLDPQHYVAYKNQSNQPASITFDFGNADTNPALGWCYKESGQGAYNPSQIDEPKSFFSLRPNGEFYVPPAPGWNFPYWLEPQTRTRY